MATETTLQRAVPVLPSLDLDATQRFYAEKLGFEPVSRYPNYAISARGGVQLHFTLTDDEHLPKETSCRLDVTGIEVLYASSARPASCTRTGPWRSSRGG